MTSIYDIARDVGVSAATVSRAMNHPELVSESTRERVLESAQRLGYWMRTPPEVRRRSATTMVSAVGPFGTVWSAQQQLHGVLEHARTASIEVVAVDHEQVRLTAQAVNRLPLGARVAGILIASLPTTPSAIVSLRARGLPTVLLGNDHPELPSVTTDQRTGARVVVEFLSSLRAASLILVGLDAEAAVGKHFLASDAQPTRDATARFTAVVAELRDRGIAVRSDAIARGTENVAESTRIIGATLAGRATPIAVFAVTDELATAALRAASQLGLTVPRDVFIVGYGDTAVAQALAMTSVREPLREEGQLALDLLLALIRNERVPSRSRLRPSIVPRSTTPPHVS